MSIMAGIFFHGILSFLVLSTFLLPMEDKNYPFRQRRHSKQPHAVVPWGCLPYSSLTMFIVIKVTIATNTKSGQIFKQSVHTHYLK